MDLSSTVTIVAPALSDGRGETAQINGLTTDTHFVGYLFDASGFDGPSVRLSQDDIVEGHGAVFGSFYHGVREFTLEVDLKASTSYAASMTRMRKLYRAFNAMAGDGTVTWTEGGGAVYFVSFRRQQPPRGPDKERKVLLSGICSDPRIYAGGTASTASAATSFSGGTALTNSGTVPTPITSLTIASPSATVNVTNSTTSETLTFTGLSGGGTVTLNFKDRTISQGGVSKAGAISIASVWWELVPGANTVTVTNAATPTWRSAWL
jgi:hypothetical protein